MPHPSCCNPGRETLLNSFSLPETASPFLKTRGGYVKQYQEGNSLFELSPPFPHGNCSLWNCQEISDSVNLGSSLQSSQAAHREPYTSCTILGLFNRKYFIEIICLSHHSHESPQILKEVLYSRTAISCLLTRHVPATLTPKSSSRPLLLGEIELLPLTIPRPRRFIMLQN